VVPGAAQAVRALAELYPLGLVSGSRREEILWALDQLGVRSCFRIVLGAEDYPHSKPAPDGYLSAMKTLGSTGPGTLVFEDSSAGIASARAAGAWVVALTCTNHFQQSSLQAHETIADLSGVDPAWVQALASRLR
jgi:HAD superfamily hydrolase (TIGR01509 family)